ncbi:MAG: NAD(P)/FAD-dependent oxidoreductase [Clostridia bacterium]|nr:NAD(P)/FAD-dependent oxidoreductase [Clostridia bacterium]
MFDVLIIGAGVIGAGIARELSRYRLKVGVLEAQSDVAMGSSGANSGIVHSGYDCMHGSNMARLNVAGNSLYDQLKKELDIPFKRIGSIVLAFDHRDMRVLDELMQQGQRNGVKGLEILPTKAIIQMEPNVNPTIKGGLWAPTGGITCPYELTIGMMENAVENGVQLYLESPVIQIQRNDSLGFSIKTPKGIFSTKYLINCAGAHSDEINGMAGGEPFRIIPRKGEYILYDKKYGQLVNHVLFHTPNRMGKGVLVAPTVDGNLLNGPSADDVREKSDVSTTSQALEHVYEMGKKSIPTLPREGVIRVFSGVRAVSDRGDFIIKESEKSKGLINVAGICSPGLTAAPAIAREVLSIFENMVGGLAKKKDFNPFRKAILKFRCMDDVQRQQMIHHDEKYGRIVCRCENITEGEIVDALARSVPARTLDAVKRRTRAGMGRCQGGFCTVRIMEIMERECGIPIDEITKNGGDSKIVSSRIKQPFGRSEVLR